MTLGIGQQETTAGLASVRKKAIVHVGISARDLAESLQAIAPEVFEEIEQKRLLQSVANLSSPAVTSAPGSLFSNPGQNGPPLAPASIGVTTRVMEQVEVPSGSSSCGEHTRSLPTDEPHPKDDSLSNSLPPVSVTETGLNGHKQEGGAAPTESRLDPHTRRLDGAV